MQAKRVLLLATDVRLMDISEDLLRERFTMRTAKVKYLGHDRFHKAKSRSNGLLMHVFLPWPLPERQSHSPGATLLLRH